MNSEKGNISVIILLVMIGITMLLVLSQILLSNKINEKISVDTSIKQSYTVDSIINILNYSVFHELNNSLDYWELARQGNNYFVNIDFNTRVIKNSDINKIVSRVRDTVEENNLYNVTIFIDSIESPTYDDICRDLNGYLHCNNEIFDLKLNLYVIYNNRNYHFNYVIKDIRIITDNSDLSIKFDISNSYIKTER